jgi:hypothetical protein
LAVSGGGGAPQADSKNPIPSTHPTLDFRMGGF